MPSKRKIKRRQQTDKEVERNRKMTEQPVCHRTMTSRLCIGCEIDAAGKCPLTDKDKNTLDKPEQPKTQDKPALVCPKCDKIFPFYMQAEFAGHVAACSYIKPEQPNTELLIVKTIQGLTTCINNELEKLVVLRGCMPINNMMVVIDQAIEVIASFEKNELYKLQKAFE